MAVADISSQSQRVTIKGFIAFDYAKSYPTALKDLATWLAQGKLPRKEYIINGGLEATPQGLVSLSWSQHWQDNGRVCSSRSGRRLYCKAMHCLFLPSGRALSESFRKHQTVNHDVCLRVCGVVQGFNYSYLYSYKHARPRCAAKPDTSIANRGLGPNLANGTRQLLN